MFVNFCTILVLNVITVLNGEEYKWYAVGVDDIISTSSYGVTYQYGVNDNNVYIHGSITKHGCGSTPGSYIVSFIKDDFESNEETIWSKIRYTQQFWGQTSCWSILGRHYTQSYGYGENADIDHGLIVFDSSADTIISNNLIYGCWNGVDTSNCNNNGCNFWDAGGTNYKGSLRAELRRNVSVSPAGLASGHSCSYSSVQTRFSYIEVGYDQNCEQRGMIKHINWDNLLNEGNIDEIPYSNFSINVDLNTLRTRIDINLEYVGKSTDNLLFNNEYILGTTYVIDFQSFETNGNSINQPGNCQNRLSSSFDGITNFTEYWEYTEYPWDEFGSNNNDNYLSYPIPSQYWTLNIEEYECRPINYNGIFSWNDLSNCKDYNGNDLINVIDNNISIILSGTLYVNVVSPYSMSNSDTGYYRTFPLIQQDFEISILKQINVLSSTGIELFITSIIGIYEDETDGSFKLSILTQSADYISLINPSVISTPLGAATIISQTSSCLVASSYTCGQIFTLSIDKTLINCPPADFSGIYNFQFQVSCPGNQQVCSTFIDDNNGSLIVLPVTSNFIDTTCEPKLYQVIFDGNMKFYDDEQFNTIHDDLNGDNNYVIGQDTIYIQIETNFPDDGSGDNFVIFGVEIDNVFVCTADDNIDLTANLTQQNGAGACLSSSIDPDGPYNIITNGIVNIEYKTQIISNTGTSNIVQFSFLTLNIGRTTMYVHVQLTLILQNGIRRRLQLLQTNDDGNSNQIRHFIDSTTIIHQETNVFSTEYDGKEDKNSDGASYKLMRSTIKMLCFLQFLFIAHI